MEDRFKFRYYDDRPHFEKMVFFDLKDYCPPNLDYKDVMQCTELKDCNGELIYEGDIIELNNNPKDIAIVKYGEFGVVDTESESITDIAIGVYVSPMQKIAPFGGDFQINNYWIKRKGIKIIGNIHENTELLED